MTLGTDINNIIDQDKHLVYCTGCGKFVSFIISKGDMVCIKCNLVLAGFENKE